MSLKHQGHHDLSSRQDAGARAQGRQHVHRGSGVCAYCGLDVLKNTALELERDSLHQSLQQMLCLTFACVAAPEYDHAPFCLLSIISNPNI